MAFHKPHDGIVADALGRGLDTGFPVVAAEYREVTSQRPPAERAAK